MHFLDCFTALPLHGATPAHSRENHLPDCAIFQQRLPEIARIRRKALSIAEGGDRLS